MALSDIVQPFVWGANGGRMTPEEIARQREIAASLLGVDTSPVGHWTQGAARMANALVGRVRESRADAASQQNAEDSKARIASLLTGLGGGAGFPETVAAGASPTSAVATGTPVSVPSAPEIRDGLISRGLPEHVADAFILNFQDESGLNPGINEQNPTVPGSRGGFGLAQWTGPRRRELEQFASQRGVDPSDTGAQLDFLMTELQGPEAKAAQSILNAPDTATAAQAIVNNFLRPAEEHRVSRAAKYGRVATTPQEAIEAIAPINGASSQTNPTVAPFDFTGNNDLSAASELSFSPQGDVGSILASTGSNFNDRWNAGTASAPVLPEQEIPASMNILPEQSMSTVSNFQPSNTEQAADPRLLALNDQIFGGALAPTGGSSGVAQALTGYFPDAPMNTAPAASAPATGGINPAIVEALSSPYVDDSTKRVAGLLLNQQFDQQQETRRSQTARDNWLFQQQYEEQAQSRDPLRQAQIAKYNREAATGGESFFGNPVAVQNADGSMSYGQIGNRGTFKPIQLGEGQSFAPPTKTVDAGTENLIMDQAGNVVARVPKNISDTEQQKVEGKNLAEAKAALPQVENSANQMMSSIDSLLGDPYLSNMVGPIDSRRSNWSADANRVQSKMDQIGGQAFMQAFNMLRGAGQITEQEGSKATAAMGRLNTAQSEKDYREALGELRDVVQNAISSARRKAGVQGETASPSGGASIDDLLKKYGG